MKKQKEKQKIKILKCKEEKGITLIALVVTIIVLIILAGVSISMLTGEGGILKQATEARNVTGKANIIEQARVDLLEKQTTTKKKITKKDLHEVLSKYFTEVPKIDEAIWDDEEKWKNTDITSKTDKNTVVKIGDIYSGTFGEETSRDWEKLLDEYKEKIKQGGIESVKPSDQVGDTYLGIGTDGKPTNMDYWHGLEEQDDGFILNNGKNSYYYNNAVNEDAIDENGKFKGTIPEYIYSETTSDFKPLISLRGAFSNLTNLVEAPELPSTVTDLEDIFYCCTSLKKCELNVPSGVTNMNQSFYCTSLVVAPELPDCLITMTSCFRACSDLVRGPSKIPSSVLDMKCGFFSCNNLIGEIKVELDSLDGVSYEYCFNGASYYGDGLKLRGYRSVIDKLIDGNSNITPEYID